MQEPSAVVVHQVLAVVGAIEQRRTNPRAVQQRNHPIQYIIGIIHAVVVSVANDIPVLAVYRRRMIGHETGEFGRIAFRIIEVRSVSMQYDEQVIVVLCDDIPQIRQHIPVRTVVRIELPFARTDVDAVVGFLREKSINERFGT